MMNHFSIPLNGLPVGKSAFHQQADKRFFNSFDNSDILDASLDVDVLVEKSGNYLGVDCHIIGELVVECDRCLEELALPVNRTVRLSVKFGSEPAEGLDLMEEEREILYLPLDADELDLGQVVYDYSLLSLPMQRVHEDGKCNPEVMGRLNGQAVAEENGYEGETTSENPFAVLKGMFNEE